MLVAVRTIVDLRQRNEKNNGLYQLKVDVGMLNNVKNELADVWSVSPSSEQKRVSDTFTKPSSLSLVHKKRDQTN